MAFNDPEDSSFQNTFGTPGFVPLVVQEKFSCHFSRKWKGSKRRAMEHLGKLGIRTYVQNYATSLAPAGATDCKFSSSSLDAILC